MKFKGKILIGVVLCVALFPAAVRIRRAFPRASSAISYHVVLDSYLSATAKDEITRAVQSYERISLAPMQLIKNLKNEVPCIQTISWTDKRLRGNKKQYTIKIGIYAPLIKVNQDFVLLQNGKLVSKRLLDQEKIGSLSSISVAHAPEIMAYFCEKYDFFKAQVPALTYADFEVEWRDESTILLHEKADPLFTHIVAFSTSFDQNLVQAAQAVKQKLVDADQNSLKKKELGWFLDMRFEKRIIAFTKKRGGDEKRIC